MKTSIAVAGAASALVLSLAIAPADIARAQQAEEGDRQTGSAADGQARAFPEPESGQNGASDMAREVAQLMEQKKSMLGQLQSLDEELGDLVEQAQGLRSEATGEVAEAQGELRAGRVAEQVRESRQRLAQGLGDDEGLAEGAIARGLADVRDAIASAARQAFIICNTLARSPRRSSM